MPIQHTEKCIDCAAGKPSTDCVEIGQSVHTNGGHSGTTNYTFFQCSKCGSVLVRIADRGLGGNGTFYQLLTRGLY